MLKIAFTITSRGDHDTYTGACPLHSTPFGEHELQCPVVNNRIKSTVENLRMCGIYATLESPLTHFVRIILKVNYCEATNAIKFLAVE